MPKLYLLDANVFIRAHEDYYPLDRVPQYWLWLRKVGAEGIIKTPFEIYDEVSNSNGPLADWMKEEESKASLLLDETPVRVTVQQVIEQGYAPDLSDDEVEKIGRDPILIGHAFGQADRCIVTKEVSRPAKQRANRKIPDVCDAFGIEWMTDFDLYRAVKFTTA